MSDYTCPTTGAFRLPHSDSAKLHGFVHVTSSGVKMSSMVLPKSFAILNARGKPGSYIPVSIALIVCRETSSSSTNLA